MKQKYGTDPKFDGPFDFIGWGTRWDLSDSFYGGNIGFEIEPYKEEQTITVMETNEEGQEVEVKKKVMVEVKYPSWLNKKRWDTIFQGEE